MISGLDGVALPNNLKEVVGRGAARARRSETALSSANDRRRVLSRNSARSSCLAEAPAPGTARRSRPAASRAAPRPCVARNSSAFLKVTMPEIEIEKPMPRLRIGKFRDEAEAVDQAGEGALPHLVFQDRHGVVVGIPGVDDQRQAGLAAAAAMCSRKLAFCSSRGLWS